MPAIDYEYQSVAGPVSRTGGTGDTYGSAACSVTLGTSRYLIIASANHRNLDGTGAPPTASDLELRWQSSRLGVSVFSSLFATFSGSSSTPEATGGVLKQGWLIDAVSGDTVSLHLRRENLSTSTDSEEVRAADLQILAIDFSLLVEGVDYVYAQATPSDTAEVVASGTTYVNGDAEGQIGQGAGQVDLTIDADTAGDWLIWAWCEMFLSGTPSGEEVLISQLAYNNGTPTTLGPEQVYSTTEGEPTSIVVNPVFLAQITLADGDTPDIRIQARNVVGGTAVGMRRTRILALRLGAFENAPVVQTSAGGVVTAGGTTDEATNGVTFNYGTAADVLVVACPMIQAGGGNWGRSWLNDDNGDVHYPANGQLEAFVDDGTTVFEDYGSLQLFHVGQFTGSQTFRLAQSTETGANTYTLGRNRGNTTDITTTLVAIHLSVPSTGGPVQPDPAIAQATTPQPTVRAVVNTAPATVQAVTPQPQISARVNPTQAVAAAQTPTPGTSARVAPTQAVASATTPAPATTANVTPSPAVVSATTPQPTVSSVGQITVTPTPARVRASTPDPFPEPPPEEIVEVVEAVEAVPFYGLLNSYLSSELTADWQTLELNPSCDSVTIRNRGDQPMEVSFSDNTDDITTHLVIRPAETYTMKRPRGLVHLRSTLGTQTRVYAW